VSDLSIQVYIYLYISISVYISGLNGLTNLTRLNLAYNQINDLTGRLDCISIKYVNSLVVLITFLLHSSLNNLTFKIRNAQPKFGMVRFLKCFYYFTVSFILVMAELYFQQPLHAPSKIIQNHVAFVLI